MKRLNALLFVIGCSVAAAAIPVREAEPKASNSLKTLTESEADFRACDRDWNHVNDFWAPSVRELYTMTSAAIQGDQAVQLIELSLQSADERHGCHVNDFWSSDVKGLYTMTSPEVRVPEVVRCLPIQYWDGIGPWHGNLWMLHRLCSGAQAHTIKLIELDSEEK